MFSMKRFLPHFSSVFFSIFIACVMVQEVQTAPINDHWNQIDQLIKNQKFQSAGKQIEVLLKQAKQRKDNKKWRQALLLATAMRYQSGKFETAVGFLTAQAWPTDKDSQLMLNLYLAELLKMYVERYRWEIQKREKINTKNKLPLKKKTLDQLLTEINQAYFKAYQHARNRNEPIEALGHIALPSLKNLFIKTDYPKNVRGGVFDTVTYLWVKTLSNSSFWSPQQSNAHFSLKTLLAYPQGINIGDSRVHPLKRLVRLLSDLENFKKNQNQPEASMEAFRVKIQQLRNHRQFQPPYQITNDERKVLVQALRARLRQPANTNLPWSNMLRADLASLLKESDADDANIQAIGVLKQCVAKHKKHRATQFCQSAMDSLLAPSLQIMSMRTDGLNKRSLQIRHKNIKKVFFKAWKIPLSEAIKLDKYEKIRQLISKKQRPDASWETALPEMSDYKAHLTYVSPPLKERGYWLIVASQKLDFKLRDKQSLIASTSLNISRFVINARSVEKEFQLTVYQGETGQVAEKVQVELWKAGYNSAQLIATKQTSSDGRVSFVNKAQQYKVVAKYGADFVIMDNLRPAYFPRDNSYQKSALIFTDRAIYRPTQKIKWKVVAYAGERATGHYKVLPNSAGWVKLLDANGKQVQKIKLKTNAYGSASGEFVAKAGLRLGQWRIQTSWADSRYGRGHSIKVEEYKRPTFVAKIEKSKTALRLNEPSKVIGSAHYYFGQAVTSAKVKWRVERSVSRVHPYWGYILPFSGVEIIKTGTASLNDEGQFTINFHPKSSENPEHESLNYRFKIVADITDAGGETRSASRIFNIGDVAVQAKIHSERSFLNAGQAEQLEIYRHDLNDVPRAGVAHWRLHQVVQPTNPLMPAELPLQDIGKEVNNSKKDYQTAGDKLTPRWGASPDFERYSQGWKDAEVIAQGTLRHDDSGMSKLNLKALSAGTYRLHYTTKDQWGKPFTLKKMIVVGNKAGAKNAASIKVPLLLKVQSDSVEVGDKIKLLAGSGFNQTPVLLEIYQGNKLLRRTFQRGGIKQFEYPVTKKNRGSVTIVATMLKDYQIIRKTQQVIVPWMDKNLNVEFSTFRDKLSPGQKETWRITVKDYKNKPLEKGAVEILASMFDKSLEFFAKHKPATVNGLYPTQNPRYMREESSLGVSYGSFSQDVQGGRRYPKHYSAVFLKLMGGSSANYSQMELADAMVMKPSLEARRGGAPRRVMRAPIPSKMAARKRKKTVEVNVLQSKVSGSDCHSHDAINKTKAINHCHPNPEASHRYGGQKIANDIDSNQGFDNIKVRENFNETAFFYPHLVLDDNGSVAFEFEVPESLTEWKVWVSAITKDLRGGSATKFSKTSKELMVRPYLPRFLRAGDQATIEVLINNSGKQTLSGKLEFDVIDPDTKQTLATNFKLIKGQRDFKVAGEKSTRLRFSLNAPNDLGLVAIRARASAGNGKDTFNDGEQRPLPILPSRIHLSQSRFSAVQGNSTRQLQFKELAQNNDKTRVNDSLVVTVDAQLFYSTLKALPYLTDYPYECTEQTMNRFLSTSIINSVFSQNPALQSLAKSFAKRDTKYEQWSSVDNDPNRKMLLEETPWLHDAQGGIKDSDKLIRVLDPKVSRAQYQSALRKLLKAQSSSGGFPWWKGGRASPYMTAYLLQGFSRALEFKVDIPKSNIQRAWRYLHKHYAGNLKNHEDIQFITLVNYVLSAYPDNSWSSGVFNAQERKLMMDQSFKNWRKLPPLLKAYLSLTLKRAGRGQEAKLVFDSIMDLAKTDKDLGTYFAPEDRSWLWYNDKVDTHAFILRTLMELNPADERRHGLVQWLMLNKKLNHWKSTRATAEAIYALVYYLKREGQLGLEERAMIKVGNHVSQQMVFKPSEYTGGHNQLVVEGDKIQADMANISIANEGKSLMFASATWHFSTEKLPKSAQGDFFHVSRRFYKRVQQGNKRVLQPLAEGAVVAVGDELEVQLSLRAKHNAEFVHLRAPRGAGFEPIAKTSAYNWQTGVGYYEEVRDSGANYFFERLPAGEYSFKYRLRATTAGQFRVAPASVQSIYAPEFNAYSSGKRLGIK